MRGDRARGDISLTNALRLARITRFYWSICERRLLSWDDTYEEMLGVKADDKKGPGHFIGPYFHPDDRARVLREYEAAEAERRGINHEFRVVLPSGAVRHIHEISEMELDADGQPSAYFGTLQDITERKLRDAELERSQRQFADAAHRAKLAYWRHELDSPSGSDTYTWAQAASTIFGGPAKELASNHDAYLRLIHPADVGRVASLYRAARAKAQSYELEYRIRQPDGQFTWVHEIGEVERRDGDRPLSYVGTVQDITEMKSAAAALEESEQRFRMMADSVPVLIWLKDESGAYSYFNRTYLDYSGRRLDEEIQADFVADIHPDDVENWRQDDAVVPTPEHPGGSLEYRLRGASGQYSWFLEVWRARFDSDGRFLGEIGVLVDITDRKRMEEEQRQTQKLQSIGRLAGGIAHDLNNLLTPILGLTEITIEGMPKDSEDRVNLEKVLVAAERAAQLVEQILTFGRRDKPNRQPVKLQSLVSEVLSLLRSVMSSSIAIRSQIEPGTPDVSADITQMHQVLMNLASNASAAMGIRGGSFTVHVAPVTLDAVFCGAHPELKPGKYAQMIVSDTGKGIDADTQKRIFEPFFTTKGVGEGTGLGLSVVHGIVTAHGGAIDVESEIGRGTTFRVYLPALHRGTPTDSLDGNR